MTGTGLIGNTTGGRDYCRSKINELQKDVRLNLIFIEPCVENVSKRNWSHDSDGYCVVANYNCASATGTLSVRLTSAEQEANCSMEKVGSGKAQDWLNDKETVFACVLVARAALRVVPVLEIVLHEDEEERRRTVILPSFRALTAVNLAGA